MAVSSINGAEKTGYLKVNEWNWTLILYSIKINSKWIKQLNIRPEIIKILEENKEKAS